MKKIVTLLLAVLAGLTLRAQEFNPRVSVIYEHTGTDPYIVTNDYAVHLAGGWTKGDVLVTNKLERPALCVIADFESSVTLRGQPGDPEVARKNALARAYARKVDLARYRAEQIVADHNFFHVHERYVENEVIRVRSLLIAAAVLVLTVVFNERRMSLGETLGRSVYTILVGIGIGMLLDSNPQPLADAPLTWQTIVSLALAGMLVLVWHESIGRTLWRWRHGWEE